MHSSTDVRKRIFLISLSNHTMKEWYLGPRVCSGFVTQNGQLPLSWLHTVAQAVRMQHYHWRHGFDFHSLVNCFWPFCNYFWQASFSLRSLNFNTRLTFIYLFFLCIWLLLTKLSVRSLSQHPPQQMKWKACTSLLFKMERPKLLLR